MNRDKLKRQLENDEDRVPYVYDDSLGYATIGVGHLVDKRKGGRLSDAAIDFILGEDIDTAYRELIRRAPWVAGLDDVRQNALLNMAFNLGIEGLMKFAKTLVHIKNANYAAAATEMLNSKWAEQVGERAVRLSRMIRTGDWP